MFNLIGLSLTTAEEKIQQQNLRYKIIRYNSRFKDDVQTDSLRVVRQRQENDGSIELVVSDFKTVSQSR